MKFYELTSSNRYHLNKKAILCADEVLIKGSCNNYPIYPNYSLTASYKDCFDYTQKLAFKSVVYINNKFGECYLGFKMEVTTRRLVDNDLNHYMESFKQIANNLKESFNVIKFEEFLEEYNNEYEAKYTIYFEKTDKLSKELSKLDNKMIDSVFTECCQ